MLILFANAPLWSSRPITGWLRGELVPKPDSADEYLVALPNGGRSLAVTPFGGYEDRDPGAAGAYESVKKRGTNLVLVYEFSGTQIIHVIPFVEL